MKYKIRLAPMAGITDWPFRELCRLQGAECCYTEMISAIGLLRAPSGHASFFRPLTPGPGEYPLIAQIFGSDPNGMADAADKISHMGTFYGIDINMGCPANRIVGAGSGSALLKNPLLAGRIMESVVKSSALPISVKIRLGWDDESINAPQIAKIAEDAGISEITIHSRTRRQQFSGKADWDMIGRVKASVSIPVIGNGDIFTAQDVPDMLSQTHADAVMIGRGALGNPWIFNQIQALLNNEPYAYPDTNKKVNMALTHLEKMCQWKSEHVAVREMRKHILWYIRGIPGKKEISQRIHAAETAVDMQAALQAIHVKDDVNA